MNRLVLGVLATAVIVPAMAGGCVTPGTVVTGSGKVETREMDFSDFSRIEVAAAFEVEVVRADSYSVSVTADDNLFEYIHVSRLGKTLRIRLKSGVGYLSPVPSARVSMPVLSGLDFSGASRGSVSGFDDGSELVINLSGASFIDLGGIVADDLRVSASGASRLVGEITAGEARLDASGASRLVLRGAADDVVLVVSGAGRAELDDFPVYSADITLSGASRATVYVDGRLSIDLSGASTLRYSGEPAIGELSITGSSTLSRD